MRRSVFVILLGVVIARLFVGIVLKFTNPASLARNEGPLSVEKTLADLWRNSHKSDSPFTNLSPVKKTASTPLATVTKLQPVPVQTIAKVDDKAKKLAEKKEADKKSRKKRRKKLEEKLAEKPETPAAPTFQVQTNPNDGGNNNGLSPDQGFNTNNFTFYPPPTPAPQQTTSLNPAAKVDLSKWIAIMTQHPTEKDLASFEALLHSNQITWAQYYQVLDLMQKSPTTNIRHLAVEGSGIALRSESFQILADESFTESDPATLSDVTIELARYQATSQLNTLSLVLTLGDLNSKIRAADAVTQIATQLTSNSSTSPAQLHALFDPFITILTPLTEDNSLPLLQSHALTALQALKNMLHITS